MRTSDAAERHFAAAFSRNKVPPAVPVVASAPPATISTPANQIEIGEAEVTGALNLDLIKLVDGRLLIQGASGAGKSWTLRRLLEQSAGMVQQIVVDPEGEFRELAQMLGHVHVDAEKFDPAALGVLARRARENRLSLVLGMANMAREDQMKAVASFFAGLIECPREHWYPVMVAIDEAHLFAPYGGQASETTYVRKAAISAVTDLMSRGRKRGLTGVLATQRLARLAKSVVSEVHNFLIGLNTLDLDIRRAAETIGWDASKAFDRLPLLTPGSFVASGPAFTRSPAILTVGPVKSRHHGAAPVITAPAEMSPESAAELLDLDGLAAASEADEAIRDETNFRPGLRAIRAFVRDPAFDVASRSWSALIPLAPEGARLADMAQHLGCTAEDLAGGLALLDGYGLVEFTGDGSDRAVRALVGDPS